MGTEDSNAGNDGRPVRRLYRSRTDKVFAGVCGGLANYLEVDPVVIRLVWLVSIFVFGLGLLLYFTAWIIIPSNPKERVSSQHTNKRTDWNLVIGLILLVGGVFILLGEYVFYDFGWLRFHFFPWKIFWPLALIALGIYLVVSKASIDKEIITKNIEGIREWSRTTNLRKNRSEKMISGVAAGIADYFKMDPTIVRLIWVAAVFMTHGLAVLAYIVLSLIMPYKDENSGGESEPKSDSQPES